SSGHERYGRPAKGPDDVRSRWWQAFRRRCSPEVLHPRVTASRGQSLRRRGRARDCYEPARGRLAEVRLMWLRDVEPIAAHLLVEGGVALGEPGDSGCVASPWRSGRAGSSKPLL